MTIKEIMSHMQLIYNLIADEEYSVLQDYIELIYLENAQLAVIYLRTTYIHRESIRGYDNYVAQARLKFGDTIFHGLY